VPKPKLIETPALFLELFQEFKKWKLTQTVQTHQLAKTGAVVHIEHTPPLTWQAFDAWLFEEKSIIAHTEDYRFNKDGRYTEYAGIVRLIGSIMFAQKFEGAAVGEYNANIIARELSLKEQSESTQLLVVPELTPEVIAKLNDEFDGKY
jgi:hypothetical protein